MPTNRQLIFALVLAVGLLGLVPAMVAVTGGDSDALARDPAATAELPWWTGALSSVGLMMWALGIGACAVGALASENRRWRALMRATALLMLLAALDDAFQFHETVAPEELGLSETFCYVFLVGLAAVWAVRFRQELLATRGWLLLLVAVFLAGSLGSDVLGVGSASAEDWLKNSGIALMALWSVDTAVLATRDVAAVREPRPIGSLGLSSTEVGPIAGSSPVFRGRQLASLSNKDLSS